MVQRGLFDAFYLWVYSGFWNTIHMPWQFQLYEIRVRLTELAARLTAEVLLSQLLA